MKITVKQSIITLLCFSLFQCSPSSYSSKTLYNITEQHGRLLKSIEVKKNIDQMTNLLEKLTWLDSAPLYNGSSSFSETEYYKESLDKIIDLSTEVGLVVNIIDPTSLLITPPYNNTGAKKVIFAVDLSSHYKTSEALLHYGKEKDFFYGYQSLYPKGFLVSLIRSMLDYKKYDSTAVSYPEILIYNGTQGINNISSIIKAHLSEKDIVLFTGGLYPVAKKSVGHINFSVQLPQDKDWLFNITNSFDKENQLISMQFLDKIEGEKTTKIQSFNIKTSFIEYVNNNFTKDPSGNLSSYNEIFDFILKTLNQPSYDNFLKKPRTQDVFNIFSFLKKNQTEWKIKNNNLIWNMRNLKINSFSLKDNILQIEMSADISGEKDSNLTEDLNMFLEQDILQLDAPNIFIKRKIIVNSYSPSYILDDKLLTYANYLSRSYKKVYKENLLMINDNSVFVPSLLQDKSLVMGSLFQNTEYYSNIYFIPYIKLYLDYNFIRSFLISKEK